MFYCVFVIYIFKVPFWTDYGIDNNLANYMTTVFDTSFGAILSTMLQLDPEFANLIDTLENSLDSILAEKNLTMFQLIKNVAFK